MCFFVSRANDLVHHAEMDLKEKRRGGKKKKKKRETAHLRMFAVTVSAAKEEWKTEVRLCNWLSKQNDLYLVGDKMN